MSSAYAVDDNDSYRRWQAPEIGADRIEQHKATAADLAAVQEHARAEGYEAGRQEGLQAARQEIRQRAERLENLMQAMAEPLAAIDEAVEQQLVALSIGIARQLIRRELSQHPDEIVAVVREAVAALPPTENPIVIHVHPEDAQLLRETLDVDAHQFPWQLQEDLAISRGGCQIVSGYVQADATLETRLQEVITRLLGGERRGDHERVSS